MTSSAAPRVRFCPAPSGSLHVGNARTALYNWLHARGHQGTFVLRIEDTDATRATEEGYAGVLEALRFLGLDWDEGPEVGGDHGPYRQSERHALYAAVVRRLVEAGAAYEAFETPEELEADRRAAEAAKRPPGYSGAHRELTDAQKAAFRAEGRAPVVRLRTPDEGVFAFDDLVRGHLTVEWASVGDFVIARADGSPTYYLANTVDDVAQGIDVIVRGEDLLSATARQQLLIDGLVATTEPGGQMLIDAALDEVGMAPREPDWDRPRSYAHLPLLVGEDRKPLSKRHGDVAVSAFAAQGYLPDVLVNLLALCGWSADGQTERFTVTELIDRFALERVGRNPAFFDTAKLRSFNGDRIKELSDAELSARLVPVLEAQGVIRADDDAAVERVRAFAPLVRERIQVLTEAADLIGFAFRDQVTYDDAAVAKHLKGRAGEVLDAAAERLAAVDPWSDAAILDVFDTLADDLGLGRGKVMQPVRVAVAGTAVSPPLPETLALLDRDVVVERTTAARSLVADA